jgi:signal transduction histidine kinase
VAVATSQLVAARRRVEHQLRESNAALQARTREAQEAAAKLSRQVDRMARLHTVMAALTNARTSADVAAVVLEHGGAALGADGGAIAVVRPEGDALELIDTLGYPPAIAEAYQRIPLDASQPFPETVRSRDLILLPSRQEALARYPQLAAALAQIDMHAWANAPLVFGDRVLGALGLSFRAPRAFSADDRTFLSALARQCAQALDRARLYEAERRARAEAETAVRLRDIFFSVAAHELKTPLTSLLGQAQLLQRRMRRERAADERNLRGVQVVAAQASRLNQMVAALLDIARIEQGQLSIERGPLDLCALALQVVEEIQPTLNRHTVVYEAAASELPIEGDALRLEQVLQNLIGNAVKYSPGGGEVRVRVGRQDGRALVAVSDQGIGIPAEALPRLFTRFFRAGNADPHGISGMGIGLYVVGEIVALHGGEIAVASQEGQGSTFTVWLPLPGGAAAWRRDADLERQGHDNGR